MLKKIEYTLEKIIFHSRWILAPFYVGLIIGIIVLFIKFIQKLWLTLSQVFNSTVSEVIVNILILVDISLVASLLLIIIFSGYEIFVSKIETGTHVDRPSWMGKVDFSGLKLKVIGAIVAISAIDLLKSFMDISGNMTNIDTDKLMWKVIIHMAFVVSGLLFAFMDKIVGDTKKH
ncbi:TIGR00645 family protein [Psychrobacter sp. DM8]|uniref:TIGR00645 family protein n=1 Tax=Psychrobacter sp. DM8 TaxID=3440636 RepID=UPI003F4FFC44